MSVILRENCANQTVHILLHFPILVLRKNRHITKRFLLHTGPKCIPFCTREYNPQCGSDGKTYRNPCLMRYATCRSNGKITLAYPGKCSKYSALVFKEFSMGIPFVRTRCSELFNMPVKQSVAS